MIGERKFNEQVESDALAQAEQTYSVEPSANAKIHSKKLKLQRELAEIERQETNELELKGEIEKELFERRFRFNQREQENKLRDEIIKLNFGQDTFTNKKGELLFGY